MINNQVMEVYKWVKAARSRIAGHIRHTTLEYSPHLSELSKANVYLKLENQQVTGSFKVRGALNKVLSLPKKELAKGVIAASTGNHAAAVAHAVNVAGSSAIIYMPKTVSQVKVDNLSHYNNIEIVLHGKDSVEPELEALRQAEIQGKVYISPYNDEEVIGGQGTIAAEILEDLPAVDSVFVPVGGGGLISGIAGYLKQKKPDAQIIGCQPENSAVMYHSIQAGNVLELASQPTVSDGTAGGMEKDSITFPICQQYVNEFHLVTENEILAALGLLLKHHYMMAEGAAGLSLASLLKNKQQYIGKNVVLIICGNKMSKALLEQTLRHIS